MISIVQYLDRYLKQFMGKLKARLSASDKVERTPYRFFFTTLFISFFFLFTGNVQAQNNLLYFISDDNNTLYTIDRTNGTVTEIGATGRGAIEAIAYYPIPGSEALYAADAGDFGTLNLTTGTFTEISEIDGGLTANGSQGAVTLNDVDGLMLDGQTLIMWAIERQSGSTPDLLFQIDITTGQYVPNAFGSGVDYLEITGTGIDVDVDDLAVDPISGDIYGVSNDGGSGDALIRVNKTTGEFEFVVTLDQDDVEGLSFHNDGKLYGSEGDGDNRLSLINKTTGAMTNFYSFSPGGDVEGLAALVAPANLIQGTVFQDDDLDGINDVGEGGLANVTVYLYLDQDGDGQIDPEDTRIQSTTTDVNGDYSFTYITTGNLLTSTEFSSYPAGFSLTTDNVESISFTDGINFGETDSNNDFGLGTGSDCDGDGLTDFFEGTGDADGDGILNQCDLDSDNDGLRDDVEGTEDFDDDGIPNYLDRDSDDDGIPDAIEANGGIRPTEYLASQGNLSGPVGTNGIVDTRETSADSGTPVTTNPDSDNDGYLDYLDLDSDNDGILDLREAGGTVDTNDDGQVDNIVDANGNGYDDNLESNPFAVPNTDVSYENTNGQTRRPNYIDIDSDADGIDDTREGLSTLGYRFPTLLGDLDQDGILDFWDVSDGSNSIVPVDTDGDGTPDYTDTNSDNDPESDFIEGNDADNNGAADVANTGLDANGNGLDDAFDAGCIIAGGSEDYSLSDHAEEDNVDGSITTTSSDLELVDETNNQTVGIRFTNVLLDQGETVSAASVQFQVDEVSTGAVSLTIQGQLSTNAAAFTTAANNVTDTGSRPRTVASESWSPADWDTEGEAGADQQTVDISSIIQEIVNQPGWSPGGSIVLFFTGSGRRTAEDDPTILTITTPDRPTIVCSSNVSLPDTDTDNEFDFRDFEGVALDTDGDGIPDADDIDDDNDGILDVDESEVLDTDADGIPNSLDLDSDNDGILDIIEAGGVDTDNDGRVDVATDTDGDGWANTFDSDNGGTALANPDSDGDGLNNFLDLDSDGDGVVDLIESQATTGTPIVPTGSDSDGDGIDNAFDVTGGTPITPVDTETDGTPDYLDIDSDNDGFSDLLEAWDTDGDGIANVNPSGGDLDVDGLDNAFDDVTGPNSTTNVYNNEDALDFPDVTTSGLTSERDWREDNAVDSDGDGIINSIDIDDDDDGILDVTEGIGDFDNDGIINSLDLDSDNDGIPDIIEAGGIDTNNDGRVEDNTDTNNNGWADTFDSANGGTALSEPDTDSDGLKNYVDIDSDGDGIVDLIESQATTGSPNVPSGTDTDLDGLDNTFDINNGGTPTSPVDTDTDMLPDYIDVNSDGDGFADLLEGWDTDGDLTANVLPSGNDADADGLDDAFDDIIGPNNTTNASNNETAFSFPDVTTTGNSERDWRESNAADNDFDGIPDVDDIDDDNDGILDVDEGSGTSRDTDGDGIEDRLDLDSDNDGIPDIIEAGGVDTNNDGRVEDDTDTDGDGWANTFDDDNGGVALTNPDSDNDGINNFIDLDSDNDGIEDIIEAGGVDTNDDGSVDAFADADADGWANTFDSDNAGTPLSVPDTDADGLENYIDIDADGDGIVDLIESQATTGSPIIPVGTDTDGDGIDNAFDSDNGGTPVTPVDTEGDSTPDYIDFNSDNDSFSDALEGYDTDNDQTANTAPAGLDSDGDGLDDNFDNVVGPNMTLNVYNNQDANDFPDVSTSGLTSERDWREVNTLDADFDGIPDGTDIDDDNDGILDVVEGTGDADGDGIPNNLDLDSDNDGIPDIIEAGGVDNDNDGRVDTFADGDNDGWANTFDDDNGGTALAEPDSDNDGVKNYIDLDSDNDGILDVIETNNIDTNGDGRLDGFIDANGDGYDDNIAASVLVLTNTDQSYESTNGLPSLPNYIDIDSDADGIDDTREGYSTIAYQAPSTFTDADNDGILDFWDVDSGNSPITPVDTDGAGLDDYVDTNSDNDSRSDFIEGNDFNGDGIADTANTGLDSNGNGLDDAFDGDCYGVQLTRISTDYAEEQDDDGSVNLGSSDLELSNDSGQNSSQTVGVYFPNITIPQGETINSAFIQFQVDEVTTGAITITIQGELSTNASTFSGGNNNVSDRLTPGTTASESWSPADWTTGGEAGAAQRTVDISSIISEIVAQGGWSSGNALVIIFTGPDGNRRTAANNPSITINYGSGITFCTSNVALQDSDIDGEFDFRESDGLEAQPDQDGDGIPDIDDVDDDNDGILDTAEGCTNTAVSGANASAAAQFTATVNNTVNAIDGANGTFASFTNSGAQMDVTLRGGSVVTKGTVITVRAQKTDNVASRMTVTESTDGLTFVNAVEFSFATDDVYEDKAYTLATDATTIRITYTEVSGDLRVDNVSYPAFTIVCTGNDTDGDGLADHLDIDADGDGIVDLIESQATTGTPVIPVGSDTDGDGLDDAFDTDCTPCGVVTGVATVLQDTDGDLTFDFLDFNSDGDTFSDVLEGWDTDGNLAANITPSGVDADNDGLDDAFDLVNGINSTTNVYNTQDANDFPDVTTGGNTERDWREVNVADSDFDGIIDTNDIDDDNDGILDVNETGDTDGDGVIDSLDLDSDNDGIPDIIEAGGVDTNNDGRVDDNTDTDNDGWANTFDSNDGGTALQDPDTDNDGFEDRIDRDADNDGIEDIIEAGGVDSDNDGAVDSFVDADEDGWANTFDSDNGGTVLTNPDTDGDGIRNNLDIDSDNDGIVDLIESQATTGTPIIPFGADSDNDGIDNAFDLTGGTPVTPVDSDTDSTPDYIDFNSDNDSYLDVLEGYDTDGDFIANTTPAGTDSDGDGLDDNFDTVTGPNSTTNVYNNEDALDFPDITTSGGSDQDWREANVIDTDADGVPDATDIDDDNDGILDVNETGDTDGDGIIDSLDLDSDNDGIPDIIEAGGVDTNNDGRVDDDTDTDGDGWANTFDSNNGGTALADPDTDADGNNNRVDIDSDNDGIVDLIESQATTGSPVIPVGSDLDQDGIDDAFDVNCTPCGGVTGIPTTVVNTDGSDNPDYIDTDSDNDGLNDIIEAYDTDGDYLANETPNNNDDDNDGLDDNFDNVVGPSATANSDNNQTANTFPNVTTAGATSERDWRESNAEVCDPGGVDGGNFLLWLKADDGGTSWRDVSNNYVSVSSIGAITTGTNINFNPSNFFGGSSYFNTTLDINADTYQDLSVIVVYQPTQNNAGAVWGEDNGGFDRYIIDSNGAGENEAVSNGNGLTGDITGLYNIGTTTISTIVLDEDQASGSTVFLNGSNTLTNFTADHGGETSNNLQIGAIGDATERFNGVIAEVIVYNSLLTSGTDLQQIQSYLAIKYGVTISTDTDGDGNALEGNEGDYIASNGSTIFWDASANTTYHNNIGAIARDDNSCLNQKIAKSENSNAIVTIGLDNEDGGNGNGLEASNSLNPNSFTSNLSALVWGHDGAALYDSDNQEYDPNLSGIRSRLNREWKVRETGDIGTVTLEFDVSNLIGPDNSPGSNNEAEILLLVDDDGDFTTGATAISQSFMVADDGKVVFRVNFDNDNNDSDVYFTLASGEQYALPITLLSFDAKQIDNAIDVNWRTLTEENNSYFKLEKLIDENFETIATIDGAGTSFDVNSYSFVDQNPIKGYNFYRLVDVDNAGEENISEVINAFYKETVVLRNPYPNPVNAGEDIMVDLPSELELTSVDIIDTGGRVFKPNHIRERTRLAVSTDRLKQGIYILQLIINDTRHNWKIMVK